MITIREGSAPTVDDMEAGEGDGDAPSASDILLDVIGSEPMTKGDIRKAVCERIAEPLWVAELEKLIKSDSITKTTPGGPRSTRYTSAIATPSEEVDA